MSLSEIIEKEWELGKRFKDTKKRESKILIYRPYEGW